MLSHAHVCVLCLSCCFAWPCLVAQSFGFFHPLEPPPPSLPQHRTPTQPTSILHQAPGPPTRAYDTKLATSMTILLVAGSLLLGAATTIAWLQPQPFPSPLPSPSSGSMPSPSFPAFPFGPLYNPTRLMSTTPMSQPPPCLYAAAEGELPAAR